MRHSQHAGSEHETFMDWLGLFSDIPTECDVLDPASSLPMVKRSSGFLFPRPGVACSRASLEGLPGTMAGHLDTHSEQTKAVMGLALVALTPGEHRLGETCEALLRQVLRLGVREDRRLPAQRKRKVLSLYGDRPFPFPF